MEPSAQPVLMSKVRNSHGPCEYTRFDNIASSHMRAGGGKIGKVEVDCRFKFTKSRWGVLGQTRNPAGIIYLDLNFRQPPDCRLESATVTVMLSEDDGEETRPEARSRCPVKLTDYYGPKCIRGGETPLERRELKNRTPFVEVLGYGAGGFGNDKAKIVRTASRWQFSGHVTSSDGGRLNDVLHWDLYENALEEQPTHSNVLHTAFALEHNGTRFYMTVHVSGRLAKRSDRIKRRLRFGGKTGQEIVTKIEWAKEYSSTLRLDRFAHSLQFAMEEENKRNIPAEFPSAMQTTFYPATNPAMAATVDQQGRPNPSLIPQSSERPPLKLRSSETAAEQLELPEPTLEELSLAAGFLPPPSPPSEGCRRESRDSNEGFGSSDTTTLTNPPDSITEGQTGGEATPATPGERPKESSAAFETQVSAILLRWLRGMGVWLVVLLAGVLGVPVGMKALRMRAVEENDRKRAKPEEYGKTGRLRLSVSESVGDYDGETCVSSGRTPSSSGVFRVKNGWAQEGDSRDSRGRRSGG